MANYQAISLNRGRKVLGRTAVQHAAESATTTMLKITPVIGTGEEPERAVINIRIPLTNQTEGVQMLPNITTDIEAMQFGDIELDLGTQIASGNPEVTVVSESEVIYLVAKIAILGKKKESGS